MSGDEHDQFALDVFDAAVEVGKRDGPAGVAVDDVAAELGWSPGTPVSAVLAQVGTLRSRVERIDEDVRTMRDQKDWSERKARRLQSWIESTATLEQAVEASIAALGKRGADVDAVKATLAEALKDVRDWIGGELDPQAAPRKGALAVVAGAYLGRNVHQLKTHPEPFLHLMLGLKHHEVRKDDRGFNVGDGLLLREWDPDREAYTGRELRRIVTYKTAGGTWGMPADLCVLSLGTDDEHPDRHYLLDHPYNLVDDDGDD